MLLIGYIAAILAIGVSIMLHEAGHLATAKAFGMKATEYFVGFGPKIWSFRRGETEYGLKAIPAGGYVKITGMTPLEELDPSDEARAFYRQPGGRRAVVLAAGSAVHLLIALVVFYGIALTVGVPDLRPVVGTVSQCVVADPQRALQISRTNDQCAPGDPVAPALQAGVRPGDEIVGVNGSGVSTGPQASDAIRAAGAGPTTITVLRDGQRVTLSPELVKAPRLVASGGTTEVPFLGIVYANLPNDTYNPLTAVWGAMRWYDIQLRAMWDTISTLPAKVSNLVASLGGAQRDPEGLLSVVGAARLGSQAIQADAVPAAFLFLASLNVFIGIFNLLPLLPLDGGHLAVLAYERGRAGVARLLGRRDPGRVDVAKLLPLTYAVVLVLVAFSLVAISADIVNPIANPFR